ncbi:uncharacterized protein BCR38DRAFT_412955 [Pseudomassariella vexata]|uniref:Uncharacterized protein n=1 Tax=Pseudomassariella vexata TaxID=1141098 RepID=A0A1Y2DJC2_9PEZI|nr:uncharacterized protein BCR38DRAFT_412955 [Pseudomassariella vexata]ORY59254.1 hypothetical protein BCR38DRAFT_412955 [Pseudomassariella vexata]
MINLASAEIREISFRVRFGINTLKMLRCGGGKDAYGQLVIKGSSTFYNVRLGEWQSDLQKHTKLYLGKAVHIQHIQFNLSQWKDFVPGIFGVAVTGAKLAIAMKASACCLIVNFIFGAIALKAGWFSVQASTIATATGPAVPLGVGFAATVYFIPWGDLLLMCSIN